MFFSTQKKSSLLVFWCYYIKCILIKFNVWISFRLHPHASVTHASLPDDWSSPPYRHHPLWEHPKVCCCASEYPQVREYGISKRPGYLQLLELTVLLTWLLSSCCVFLVSLPLGSQVIAVPVNSSLSWHMNRLRDPSRDAYNVSYAWKLVSYSSAVEQALA